MNRGEYQINSGRKSKSAELELFSKLTVYDNLAIDTLIQGVKEGNFQFIKLSYKSTGQNKVQSPLKD